jgi:biopolymer transport protein ExbD
MKIWLDEIINEKVGLQIVPLIDCVFLLLFYFMVSSSLKRTEADLSLTLPGAVAQSQAINIPDEQIIEVHRDGAIVLNGRFYTDTSKMDLRELEATLTRYNEASRLANVPPAITISADDDATHERIVDVLNTCAGAGIKTITFGGVN